MENKSEPIKEIYLPHVSSVLSDVVSILVRPDDCDSIDVVRTACRQKCDQLENMGYYVWDWVDDNRPKLVSSWQMYQSKCGKDLLRYHAIITAQKVGSPLARQKSTIPKKEDKKDE